MLFQLSNLSTKCLLTSIRCYRIKLDKTYNYSQFRNFKRKSTHIECKTLVSEGQVDKIPVSFSKLWKPFGFTLMFGTTAFIGESIWQYESFRAQRYAMAQRQRVFVRLGWRAEIHKWWRSLREYEKVYVPILLVNCLVWGAWRIPALSNTMTRYFTTNPATGLRCWPMVFSMFSHYSLLHLAANMYALKTISELAVAAMNKEHFVAFYLTSGVVANFASYAYRVITTVPGGSLGASGAIMGILGYVCTQCPDVPMRLLFYPNFTFLSKSALQALLAIDLTGCILRWKFFDHAAHLGGVLFGMFWVSWGRENTQQKRVAVLKLWHSLREPPRIN